MKRWLAWAYASASFRIKIKNGVDEGNGKRHRPTQIEVPQASRKLRCSKHALIKKLFCVRGKIRRKTLLFVVYFLGTNGSAGDAAVIETWDNSWVILISVFNQVERMFCLTEYLKWISRSLQHFSTEKLCQPLTAWKCVYIWEAVGSRLQRMCDTE